MDKQKLKAAEAVLSLLLSDFTTTDGVDDIGAHPFEIGKCYLICTVTRYHVGRLVAITPADFVLEGASWIPDTGRFHDCLRDGTPHEVEPFATGKVIVSRGGYIDATEWTHPLPENQK